MHFVSRVTIAVVTTESVRRSGEVAKMTIEQWRCRAKVGCLTYVRVKGMYLYILGKNLLLFAFIELFQNSLSVRMNSGHTI